MFKFNVAISVDKNLIIFCHFYFVKKDNVNIKLVVIKKNYLPLAPIGREAPNRTMILV